MSADKERKEPRRETATERTVRRCHRSQPCGQRDPAAHGRRGAPPRAPHAMHAPRTVAADSSAMRLVGSAWLAVAAKRTCARLVTQGNGMEPNRSGSSNVARNMLAAARAFRPLPGAFRGGGRAMPMWACGPGGPGRLAIDHHQWAPPSPVVGDGILGDARTHALPAPEANGVSINAAPVRAKWPVPSNSCYY